MEEDIISYLEEKDTPEMRNKIGEIDNKAKTTGLTIKVVDTICGGGKTTAAINMINAAPSNQKFLFITPYLQQVDRIIKECPEKHFQQPDTKKGTKLRTILSLFNRGANIASTHSLFLQFNEQIMELVRIQKYTLILDEVVEVVKEMDDIKGNDLNYLLKHTIVEDDGIVRWNHEIEYDGVWLEKYRNYIDLGALYYYKDTALLYLFPVKCFTVFKDVYILTYMFDAQIQRCYYDYNEIKYEYMHVEGESLSDLHFVDGKAATDGREKVVSRISIVDDKNLNDIGDRETALSVSWYDRNRKTVLMTELKNRLYNFFRNISKTPSEKNMWTTFNRCKGILKGGGYSKGFVACNARATNEYKDKTVVAYLCNRYYDPILKGFFLSKGIRVEENQWALSELIQYLFRSAIRKGEKEEDNGIICYIPSRRMRGLLKTWLEGGNKDD